MSLMSLISGNTSSQSSTTYISPAVSAALAKLQNGNSTAAPASGTTGDGVTISPAAQAAAAETADNAKDFTALATATRADLDAQYAAEKAKGQAAKPI